MIIIIIIHVSTCIYIVYTCMYIHGWSEYSSLNMSTLCNMHILNACTHNVSLYTNITDQWVRSRSPTMLSISLVIYMGGPNGSRS